MSSGGEERRGEGGRRGDEERQRTQTSRPDLYSTSKTFLQDLPIASSLPYLHTRTGLLPHTYVLCIVYLLTHAYLSLRLASPRAPSCSFPPRVVIADYVRRFPNEDWEARMYVCLDFSARVIVPISSEGNKSEFVPPSSIGKRSFSIFSADEMKLLGSVALICINMSGR